MIYRRRILGHKVESIEIAPAADALKTATLDELFQGDSIKVVFEKIEDDTQIYHVQVPPHLKVKPPDWRDLAYDHKEVERRISVCVTDNCQSVFFEPINETSLKKIQQELSEALEDLSSIMDCLSVECAPQETPGRFTVSVEFEHKNGERKNLVIGLGSQERA